MQLLGVNLSILLGGIRLRFVLGFEEIADEPRRPAQGVEAPLYH